MDFLSVVGSEELERLVPDGCSIGHDVLVYVGKSYLNCRDNERIVMNLREKNEEYDLTKNFLIRIG